MADLMPVRKSTNQVEGINRCECGKIRTIHRARGKRAKFLYSICDDCGTNQQTGAFWQSRFNVHYPAIEALTEAEQATVVKVSEPNELTQEAVTHGHQSESESLTKETPPILPKSGSESSDSEATAARTESVTSRIEPEKEPEAKPSTWKAILAGIVLGGLTGGLITRI
ncbi:hypothetical protein [Photobacterium nomapromontoriensis]|uniref:hypothetical protein n=1 Tax=Photobacterium nomapromontoriensis TaxID=2910237 RepID=UPI003D151978